MATLMIPTLTIYVATLLPQAASSARVEADEAEVLARVAEFSDAFVAADAERLGAMLTDDYLHSGPTGSILTKRAWLDWIVSRRAAIESGSFRFESYQNHDVRVRIYGNTAIVNGRNSATGRRDGEPFAWNIRFTHVWVRQDGRWRRAAFHDSRISPPSGGNR
jgi:ketosteroid isomerase-like protein